MKIVYKNKKLIDADSNKPNTLAVIDKSLPSATIVKIGLRCEYGVRLFEIYQRNRDNLDLKTVVDMLKEMESDFLEYENKLHKSLFDLLK